MNTIKNSVLAIGVALVSASALATPQYTGVTTNDGDLALNQGAGYYLWNDLNSPAEWSLRWTGDGAEQDIVEWFGEIVFQNKNLGTFDAYKFEVGGTYGDTLESSGTIFDRLEYVAFTNNTGGVDGIDFTIDNNYELMQFTLGSSLFSELTSAITDPGVESQGIYIGSGYSSTNALVFVTEPDGSGTYQQFEVFVPEPGTLALLGLGLVGLSAARRKKA